MMRRRQSLGSLVLAALAAECSGCDHASAATSAGKGHETRPAATRATPSGRSDIEGRYVYAPPDEGAFTVPLTLDMALPGELSVEEPAMVAGSATVRVQYSRKRNKVTVDLEAHGLPFRPSFTKGVDDRTTWNVQPTSIKDARWQLWLAGTMFGRQHEDLYYREGTPREFLGTRYDFAPLGDVDPPVPGSYELMQGNTRQMIALPMFEGTPNGESSVHFVLDFDRMADIWGTPGAINMTLPFDGCEPDAISNYWTHSMLPADKFMTWDTFLQSIWSGEGIGFLVTAEPTSRSAPLGFHESGFVGWANTYPAVLPRGFGYDYCSSGTLIPIHERTYQLALWPPTSRRHLCRSSRS